MLKYFERIQSKKCNSVVYEIKIPNINLHIIPEHRLDFCPYDQKKTSGKEWSPKGLFLDISFMFP